MLVLTKIALVVLAGIYAMRTSNDLFHPEELQPLSLVAAFAFVMSLVIFHRPPTVQGWWQYTVIGLSLVGVVANTALYIAPDASHGSTTNLTFSVVSVAGWAVVALSSALLVFAQQSADV